MESVRNKLQSTKFLQDSNNQNVGKDAPKRVGDVLPDTRSSKRILGNITNSVVVPKGKSGPGKTTAKKDAKSKGNQALLSSNNKEKPVIKEALQKNEASKTLTSSEESAMDITVIEMHDSAIDVSNIKEELEVLEKDQINPLLPEGVLDFDATCLDDPYSVADYVGDIFQYYRNREKRFVIKKYLDKQSDMTKSMRAILVDWMVEVQESFELNHETLYLAVKLVDFYLMNHFVAKSKLQLIGATAVFIAAKFDERMPPLVDDFLYICDDSYTRGELLDTEVKILRTVNFDLGIPLSYRFLRRFARCSRISMEMLTLARFILETALMDYELIEVLDSKIASAALLLALRMKNQSWNITLEHYTGYKEFELEDVLVHLNKNIAGPPSKHLQTIRTKYSHPIFFEVAKVPALKVTKSKLLENVKVEN